MGREPPAAATALHAKEPVPGHRTAQALALFADRDETCLALVSEVAKAAAPAALTTVVDPDTEAMLVPRLAVGRVIGKKGATIRDIEVNSGARVSVDKDGDRTSDIVEVRVSHPDAANRAQAIEAITDIVSRCRYPPPKGPRPQPAPEHDDGMDLC